MTIKNLVKNNTINEEAIIEMAVEQACKFDPLGIPIKKCNMMSYTEYKKIREIHYSGKNGYKKLLAHLRKYKKEVLVLLSSNSENKFENQIFINRLQIAYVVESYWQYDIAKNKQYILDNI